jgi:hypothetical protein
VQNTKSSYKICQFSLYFLDRKSCGFNSPYFGFLHKPLTVFFCGPGVSRGVEFRIQLCFLGFSTDELKPAADAGSVSIIGCAEGFGEAGFLQRNDGPVEVDEDERQEEERPDLFQVCGFAEISEGEADVHGIAGEAIGAAGDEALRRLAGGGGGVSAMEKDEAPSRDDGAGQEYRDAGEDADPCRGVREDGVRKEALGDQCHEIGENENPRYRNAEEETDRILH